jgi:hypothetical protein
MSEGAVIGSPEGLRYGGRAATRLYCRKERRIDSAEWSASSSVVFQPDTEIRMAGSPRHCRFATPFGATDPAHAVLLHGSYHRGCQIGSVRATKAHQHLVQYDVIQDLDPGLEA